MVYVDGAVQTISNKDYLLASGSSASISLNNTTDLTGNGSVTEVFRDRDGNVTSPSPILIWYRPPLPITLLAAL